jgi:hypothetical protein
VRGRRRYELHKYKGRVDQKLPIRTTSAYALSLTCVEFSGSQSFFFHACKTDTNHFYSNFTFLTSSFFLVTDERTKLKLEQISIMHAYKNLSFFLIVTNDCVNFFLEGYCLFSTTRIKKIELFTYNLSKF